MTDSWGHYLTEIDGQWASVLFDDGIAETIDRAALSNALRIRIELHDPQEDGFPTVEEGERLLRMEERIERLVVDSGGLYLGQITVAGLRWLMTLISGDDRDLKPGLDAIAAAESYKLQTFAEPDPEKQVYWNDLYPSDQERRTMRDLAVLNSLQEHGDQLEISRPVDHWSVFTSNEAANLFSVWLTEQGYQDVQINHDTGHEDATNKWIVRSRHEGSMLINDISHHTLSHDDKSRELGGEYDGWETQVMTGDEPAQ